MARMIASIPFWILAGVYFLSALVWMFDARKEHSASARMAARGFIISGFWGVIAVWVMG